MTVAGTAAGRGSTRRRPRPTPLRPTRTFRPFRRAKRTDPAGTWQAGGLALQSRRSKRLIVASRPGPTPIAEIRVPLISSSAST